MVVGFVVPRGGVQLDDCSAFDSLLLTVPTAPSPIVEAAL